MSLAEALPEAALVERIKLWRVVSSAFRVVRAKFWVMSAVALPWVIVPQAIAAAIPKLPFAASALFGLPGLVFEMAATLIAYNHLVGRPPLSFSEVNGLAVSRFGSLFGARFIANIATGLGLILLIVPGVVLLAGWMVATPAIIIEGKSSMAALQRSWDLTRGSRWRLAALIGILSGGVLVGYLALLAAAVIVGLAIGAAGGVAAGSDTVSYVAGLVGVPLITFALTMFMAAGWTATYVELRSLREGPLDIQIATTFD